ncbi:MAG TPA: helix-turn-helix domain-containing protein [Jatrophihabitans sp.]|nr:helix-turn-helix domain-containing protein [Jatrophihabitans sp.]
MTNPGRRYGDPCGIARALDVVGERWALLIVRELLLGPRRFGQLRAGLPDLSPNVLTQRLRELADAGIVERSVLEPPASVTVYELSERGRALEPVLLELGRWGSETPRIGGREMSTASLLVALKTMFDPTTDATVTYVLRIGDEAFTVAIADGSIDVRRGADPDAAAELAADVTTFRMIVFLGTGVRAAEHAGALTIAGDRRVAARFPAYFRAPAAREAGGVSSPARSARPSGRRHR